MSRVFVCCVLLCLGTLTLAQNAKSSAAQTSPTPVQVVYLLEGTTIVTYNVDPETLNPSQIGSLTVPAAVNNPDLYPGLTAVLNDQFIYYRGYATQTQQRVWVFATDATGAPQLPAVQQFNVTSFGGLQVDPKANFAYVVSEGVPSNGSYTTPWYLRRFVIDPVSGKLSQSQIEATYALDNGAEGTTFCGLSFLGFNSSGTRLYDEVACSGFSANNATYNERTVNLTTGALGSDVEVYSWSNGTEGYESVQFVGDRLFDFVTPNDYQPGAESVNIYPVVPVTSTPLLTCTAEMLEACGYSTGMAHPSGEYIFMAIAGDLTQIDKVEVSQEKIVDTSNYIPYEVTQFSPDGTLVYGVQHENSGYQILISGFNVATSAVTPGGSISAPSMADPFYVAERQ